MNETIVAQATPIGKGGVAIIRISGQNALPIVQKIFCSKQSTTASQSQPSSQKITSHHFVYGTLDTGEITDNVLMVYFQSPHSYTGEDVVEIHCHGSQKIVECILASLIRNGCRLAQKGEFTRRAVLNQKLDLVQAESIQSLIDSDTILKINASNYSLSGQLSTQFTSLSKDILSLVAQIEAVLDYPEDVTFADEYQQFANAILAIITQIDTLLAGFAQGRRQMYGVNVCVVGATNAGKSSLVNALLGYDRAIVTDIEGTTRDTITDEYEYKGVKFLLTDTAGIRPTTDIVEQHGITRTYDKIKNSDIILSLDDSWDKSLTQPNTTIINIHNKIDLLTTTNTTPTDDQTTANPIPKSPTQSMTNHPKTPTPNQSTHNTKEQIRPIGISAKFGTNIPTLKQVIFDQSIDTPNIAALSNQRHFDALSRARDLLTMSHNNLKAQATLDIIATDARAAWIAVASITSLASTDDLLDQIFSQFCLGK